MILLNRGEFRNHYLRDAGAYSQRGYNERNGTLINVARDDKRHRRYVAEDSCGHMSII
jgi:hypothetical protein